MNYHIHITSAAERDLSRAADHIEFVLKNPKAANDLLDEAEKQISSLSEFPEKFKLVDDPIKACNSCSLSVSEKQLEFYSAAGFSCYLT